MNNAINMPASSTKTTSDTVVASSRKEAVNEGKPLNSRDAASPEDSFQATIQKTLDESGDAGDMEVSEAHSGEPAGKDLPLSGKASASAEKDDHPDAGPGMPPGLYIGDQPPEVHTEVSPGSRLEAPQSAAESETDNSTDPLVMLNAGVLTAEATGGKGKASPRTAPASPDSAQPATNDIKAAAEKRLAGSSQNSLADKNAGPVNTGVVNTGIHTDQALDLPVLKTELPAAVMDRGTAAAGLTGQQPLSVNAQALLSAVSAQTDTTGDGLPQLVNNTPLGQTTGATPSSTVPQQAVATPFGQPAWAQGMGKQIMLLVNQNISRAEIRLNPAHLGPVEVMIDMSDDQVNVSLSSRHAVVRDAMEQALPRLREMLNENGFTLADADISRHSFADQREQQYASHNGPGADSDGFSAGMGPESQDAIQDRRMTSASAAVGIVDYYI